MMRDDGPSPADFAQLASDLHAASDRETTARTIVTSALALVPGADEVSLTLRRRNEHTTLASTGAMASAADDRQYALREGPCVEVAVGEQWLRSGDVARDPRWPRWGPQAAGLGVRSICSVQLPALDRQAGSLNIYSSEPGTFADPDDINDAAVVAVHAATALRSATLAENLSAAIDSRHEIGMAQGILMERFGLDVDRSFELLRRISSTTQQKLRDVAAGIVRTGQVPAIARPGDDEA